MKFTWKKKEFCPKNVIQKSCLSCQPASLPVCFINSRPVSPHNHISQFPEIPTYIKSPIGSVSLESSSKGRKSFFFGHPQPMFCPGPPCLSYKAKLWVSADCCQCQAWGHLAGGMGAAGSLRLAVAVLKDSGSWEAWATTSHSYGKATVNICKLDETEPQGISRVGQTVLARLMESQIWYQPASSVTLWVEGSEKKQWLLPAFLSQRKLSPNSRLDVWFFSFSLYATGAFQAAILVLELRVHVWIL